MHMRSFHLRRRLSALTATATVLTSSLVMAVAPSATAAPEPQTYTVTYQCDPNLPNYGTNSTGGAEFGVRIGDTVRVAMNGSGCREGSMHTRGDLGMFETTPGWTMSCCSPIPSGTVYTMKVVKYSETVYGKGWIGLSFFKNNYASAQQVYIRVAPPEPTVPGPLTITRSLVDEDQAYVYFDAPLDGNSPLTSYEWRLASPTTTPWTSYRAAEGSPAWINGLDPGVEYTVELRAVNRIGPGPSTTTTIRTISQPPSAPFIDAIDPEDGALVVSFVLGTTGGSPIRTYQYRLDGGEWQDAGTDSSPVRIDGLENGRTYEVELRALNATETGDPSSPVSGEPNVGSVDLWICHWDGDRYDFAFITARPGAGAADHGDHSRDIVPDYAYYPGGNNWDDDGFWTWVYGCVKEDAAAPDSDEDGQNDVEDADDDNDGMADAIDEDDDGDGIADRYDADHEFSVDSDGDGVPNAGESDDDGDGIADAVDSDGDGDGVLDVEDQDRPLPADTDNDGAPDALDADDDGDCLVDASDADRDGDEIPDAVDPDLDNDGLSNEADLDANGDGRADTGDGEAEIVDLEELSTRAVCDKDGAGETDAAGTPLTVPVDTDLDGVPNTRDTDDDGDGIADALDRDSDGDNVLDTRDGDANGDGTPETIDQPLTTPFRLDGITAGQPITIVEQPLRTVAGQRATVDVECGPAKRSRSKVAGDIGAPDPSGRCLVVKEGGALRLFVYEGKPTAVTVRVSAPAVGPYRPHTTVVKQTVR